jgi:DNA-binding NtrC family response regulator
MLDRGEFRQDLYYRISTIVLEAPPLRRRPEDIEEIAQRIVGECGMKLSREAVALVRSREWRGNVRELRNCLEVAASISKDGGVDCHAVQIGLRASGGGLPSGQLGRREPDAWEVDSTLLTSLPEQFTTRDVLHLTGGSRRSVQRRLAEFVATGRLARIGAGRATRYQKKQPAFAGERRTFQSETPR